MNDHRVHVDCLAALAGALDQLQQQGYTDPKIHAAGSGQLVPVEILPRLEKME